ncbi:Riean_0653 family protein [Hymenobacter ruber]
MLLPLLGMRKCEREPVPAFKLPAATQSGANTFGFMIDGRVWQNYGWLPYTAGASDNLRATYSPRYGSKNFSISAGQIARDVYEEFYLSIDSLTHAGTYQATKMPLPGANVRAERGFVFNNKETQTVYSYLYKGSNATITITKLDTAEHIIAGTFTGDLSQGNDSTKRVHIIDGRFDVRY